MHITDPFLVIVVPQSKNVMSGQSAKLLSTSYSKNHPRSLRVNCLAVSNYMYKFPVVIMSFVHYINIYSRIVIQLNMYVKIITSSGFKLNNFDGFCARTASGSVSLWHSLADA